MLCFVNHKLIQFNGNFLVFFFHSNEFLFFCILYFVFIHSALCVPISSSCYARELCWCMRIRHIQQLLNKNGERFGLFLFAHSHMYMHARACVCVSECRLLYVHILAYSVCVCVQYIYVYLYSHHIENWTYLSSSACIACVCVSVCVRARARLHVWVFVRLSTILLLYVRCV